MIKPDYRLPTIDEIHRSTKKRSPEREAMAYIYGNPYGFCRRPIYNNMNFQPEEPIVGSVRTILDEYGRGLRVIDALIANETFDPLDATMGRVKDMFLDTDLVMQVYERLSTSRILSKIKVCAALEVVTDLNNPGRVAQASIVYPEVYERGEKRFVPPAVVGEQMALLYLQQT